MYVLVNTLYTAVMFTYYILPKSAKTREPKDWCCVLWCTHTHIYIYIDNIHDPLPLDKLKNHTALPYITWGLIWDSKNKRGIPKIKIFHQDLEIKEEIPTNK